MFADPSANVAQLKLKPGMTVADFGTGSGAYALAVAKLLGTSGRVYAIDVQKDLLDRVVGEARSRGINNIEVVWGNVEKHGGSKLADNSVDTVIISNLLFQSTARYSIVLEVKRILKSGGEAVVIEWQDSFGGLGPAPAAVLPPAEAEQIFTEAGLSKAGGFRAGEHHWGLIFKKP